MLWKECNAMDERLKFVARLLDGEKMAVMCREFGNILQHSGRKTGLSGYCITLDFWKNSFYSSYTHVSGLLHLHERA